MIFRLLCALAVGCLAGCAATRPTVGPPLQELTGEFRAVAAADLEGDGEPALCVLEARQLYRAELVEGAWVLAPLLRGRPGTDWLGMSAGDVDGDGRDELVLWSGEPPSSAVFGWDGEQLVREAGYAPVFLRIVRRGAEILLAGQRAGAERPFHGDIQRYTVEDGDLVRGEALHSRPDWTVHDFVYAPADDSADPQLYTFDDGGNLERRSGNAVVWRSEQVRMARPLWVERQLTNLLAEQQTIVQDFSTEPVVTDLDGDGVDEVLMVTSDAAPVRVLERVRGYRGGSYLVLKPESRGLGEDAASLMLGRFATGIAAFDVDGDDKPEAVMTVVLKRRSGVSKGTSSIVVLDALSGDLLELGRPAEP